MRKLQWAALGVLLAASVAAQEPRPSYGPAISGATAKKLAEAALAECQKNQWNVVIAVVDTHGYLVYFERMEDAPYASNDIAIGKARSAATYRRPTRVLMEAINKSPAIATLGGAYASPGGVPISADGRIVGAVGISGVTGDQDEQCARAGIARAVQAGR